MLKFVRSLFSSVFASRIALVPEGWCLVREKPTEAHIESMCMRFDHSHGVKHYLPNEESEAHFQARRNFNRTMVLQLYEEATGQGFYKLDPHEPVPELEPDWMERCDFIKLRPVNPNLRDCAFIDGLYYAPCRACGSLVEVDDPESFAQEHNYCGGSPRCCP